MDLNANLEPDINDSDYANSLFINAFYYYKQCKYLRLTWYQPLTFPALIMEKVKAVQRASAGVHERSQLIDIESSYPNTARILSGSLGAGQYSASVRLAIHV